MLRISRLTDYGIVLSTALAQAPAENVFAVSELADRSRIPAPTVAKVLKQLTRAGIVESLRGARGGYRLSRPAAAITVREVITALEGPIAVTECASDTITGSCEHEGRCDVQGNWQRINAAIQSALDGIRLSDLAEGELISLERMLQRRAG
jgi:FeS assembly SUF system regulator